MKAIVYYRYGSPDVLEFKDVDMPVIGDDEVLVRVRAASVNPYDWHMVTGTPYIVRTQAGLRKPKLTVPGVDMAGQVEAVGRNVTRLQPGDDVFGMRSGAFAEYVRVREARMVLKKPANLSFEQAAAVPMAALTALQGLRDKGQIQPGQEVLVNGASGGVGTFAVQIAKSFGASVTGVCSTGNVDLVRSIGADQVIDYTQTDFTDNGQRYDLILDAAGTQPLSARKRALRPRGTLVVVGGAKKDLWVGPLTSTLKVFVSARVGSKRLVSMLTKLSREDLVFLQDLLEAGSVTPVVGGSYPLHEVPEALRLVGTGHARGKVVITV